MQSISFKIFKEAEHVLCRDQITFAEQLSSVIIEVTYG